MAKGYAILRVEKIKTGGSLMATLLHLSRERTTLNADPERTKLNEGHFRVADNADPLMSASAAAYAYHKEQIASLRKRKDSVLALEYLVAASPDALGEKEMKDYLMDALVWINKRHPGKRVGYAMHLDETTPHIHVVVIPTTKIRDKHGHEYDALSARPYTGSGKLLSAMQTNFAAEVGQKFGLQRGIEGSVARHDRVKRGYGALGRGPQHIPSKMLTPEEIAKYPDNKADLIDKLAGELKTTFVEAWGDRTAAAELEAENKARAERILKREEARQAKLQGQGKVSAKPAPKVPQKPDPSRER